MTPELKPCPFCGGEAFFSIKIRPHPHVVECRSCTATCGGSAFENNTWNAKCWNTRAPAQGEPK